MTKITRRKAASLVAALPLAAACGGPQDKATNAASQTSNDVTAPPPPPPAMLTQDELDMVNAMSSEFELADNWRGDNLTVAPTETSDKILREGLRGTVTDTYARLRGGADYFNWPEDKDSIDYHHLVAMGSSVKTAGGEATTALDETVFELTHVVLKRITAANSFDIATGKGAKKLVFGLRGCVIDGDGGRKLAKSVMLKEARPDHNHLHCVIGVWDPDKEEVAVFKSSTVPLEVHLAVYQRWLVERAKDPEVPKWNIGACMIPQGLHTKRVATMHMGSGTVCPVTLKQESPMPVLRESDPTKNTLSLDSRWDPEVTAERARPNVCHIHATINAKWNTADYQFSSQGCQTVHGWYENNEPFGEISDFNLAMGFENEKGLLKSKSNGSIYQFMLVTGREARLHAAGAEEKVMRRVRIGSSTKSADHIIVKLNKQIGAGENKKTFDDASMLKLLKAQTDGKLFPGVKPDGIYGPVTAASGRFGDAAFPV